MLSYVSITVTAFDVSLGWLEESTKFLSRWSVCQQESNLMTPWPQYKTPAGMSAKFWSRILEYHVLVSATVPGAFHRFLQFTHTDARAVRNTETGHCRLLQVLVLSLLASLSIRRHIFVETVRHEP
jgi:hypothetical protein